MVVSLESSADEITHDARLAVDSIPGLVALLAPDGDVLFVNRRILEYTGRTLQELKQWSTGDTVHPDDLAQVIRVFTQSVASGSAYEIMQRLRRSDGIYRWFQHSGVPLRDATGQVVRWYVLLTDVDERKRAEALLAGEKRLLEMVASGSPLPTVLDALCTLVEENATNCHCGVYLIDQREQVFQSSASPTLQATYNDPLVGSPVSPRTRPCGMAASLKRQVIAADVETDPLWMASPFRPLALAHGLRSCWSTPIVSPSRDVLGTFAIYQRQAATPTPLQQELIGRVTHLASIAIERAQREKAGAELAHVSRMTTLIALTASIAHEVNQPLAGIITNAGTCLRMLDAVPPNIAGARDTARRTIRDGNRAADVITRLRALFSRKELTPEPLDLNEAAREVIALSASDLQRHRVILRAELAEGLPLVAGDRIQLQQVILNLLRNAADAMVDVRDRPRHLLIRSDHDEGDCVRVTVRDAGVGLPPQSSKSLFDAFYTTKTGGMGIGLFVSRSIIERHQGRLWAEPNDDGPGATFSFSIPCDAPIRERSVTA